jgi:signal transduction histidine kinase
VVAGVVAVTTWLAVGGSLAPVERMRRQLESVTATDLAQRVDDPATRDELSRLAHTMNEMLTRLQDAQTAQRRFVSDASHELRSPLASMRQFAEVATAYPGRVSREELAEVVLDEGARLQGLVDGMLVLTRADERALALRRADVDLARLVSQEVRHIAADGGPAVAVSAPRAAVVAADAGMLRQVVRNLTINAQRHARSCVEVSIGTDARGGWMIVDDDGPGIPPGERERVFERFVRLDDARSRDAGGSGLGLAIVRELVHAHGGSVTADASPLGGARFVVRLPR